MGDLLHFAEFRVVQPGGESVAGAEMTHHQPLIPSPAAAAPPRARRVRTRPPPIRRTCV